MEKDVPHDFIGLKTDMAHRYRFIEFENDSERSE